MEKIQIKSNVAFNFSHAYFVHTFSTPPQKHRDFPADYIWYVEWPEEFTCIIEISSRDFHCGNAVDPPAQAVVAGCLILILPTRFPSPPGRVDLWKNTQAVL